MTDQEIEQRARERFNKFHPKNDYNKFSFNELWHKTQQELIAQERSFQAELEKVKSELQTANKAADVICKENGKNVKQISQITAAIAVKDEALKSLINVGSEQYDMDMGPNGSWALEMARTALSTTPNQSTVEKE